jgi:hypothetical protein
VSRKVFIPIFGTVCDDAGNPTAEVERLQCDPEPTDFVPSQYFLNDETFEKVLAFAIGEAARRASLIEEVPF